MSYNDAKCVKKHFRLQIPSGELLPTKTVWFHQDESVTMRILLTWDGWEQVASEGLFGFKKPDFPEDLLPDNDVVIETRLRSECVKKYTSGPDTVTNPRVETAR